ncbi:undecaprenyl-diphosphate phosphatase [Stomatobaculum sp. F0698]|jgi:undecaprenyl-diphosphatase uppP|uniref:undecaprenyl-diphosphate phosphatase n=1 Tax=Stomatobaculum sp. F0698 TaxID=3059030 RepID=UPI00272C93B6|nr:undecaprenyl-diphosphate phosphatase [Stomatobaculum sp. F0698]WLD86155.1 undecaprenyl-diphosphate phosphatase [Stomatobaculum sp. F0698]
MRIIEILKVIVLGMVEGFTEWLPISSTGHLILINQLIHLDVSPEFMEMFRVVIQLGAILAVVMLYFDRLNPLSRSKRGDQRRVALTLWSKIIVACIPAAILGKLLDDWMDAHLYNGLVVSIMLVVYGVLFILIENRNQTSKPQITKMWQLNYQTALYIGMFQVLALIPGTSRSGVTILGAVILGCSRAVAAEFSFFVGIPVMLGASLLKLAKFGFRFSNAEILYLVLGMAVAFLVSVYSIRFLMSWVKKNDFKVFGYYRIVLGVIVLIWYVISTLMGKPMGAA